MRDLNLFRSFFKIAKREVVLEVDSDISLFKWFSVFIRAICNFLSSLIGFFRGIFSKNNVIFNLVLIYIGDEEREYLTFYVVIG